MNGQIVLWIGFAVFVVLLLVLDLGVFNRRPHEIKVKEALIWSAIWIATALVFNLGVYYLCGSDAALKFFTGYLIEKSLSVDNLFVFLLIFSYFRVPAVYQHKILFYGIIGAVFMRTIFILAGIALINMFHWVIYLFGMFLVYTGIHMAINKDVEIHPEKNLILKIFRKFISIREGYDDGRFFWEKDGRRFATTLFVVLLVVETSDLMFAVDSIPAILAITTDPFIVITSNIFAILGLRALYFALAAVMKLFHYLHYGLSLILFFIGAKMLLNGFYKIPVTAALGVVALILSVAVIASIIWPADEPDMVSK
ncbi:MAG: TerC family protein [Elusimicrobiota bacterium]